MVIKSERSLKASAMGIRRANRAVMVFATKIDLAAELEISRATVQNFFAGKPIGRENFHKICKTLKLPWNEVAEFMDDAPELSPSTSFQSAASRVPSDLDSTSTSTANSSASHLVVSLESSTSPTSVPMQPTLEPDWKPSVHLAHSSDSVCTSKFMQPHLPDQNFVGQLRREMQTALQQRCGSVRVLEMSQPTPVRDLYIEVNLLRKIQSRQWLNLAQLQPAPQTIARDRLWLNPVAQHWFSGTAAIAQHSKLLILGKPGAGKTMFLKQLALRCLSGELWGDRVAFFITLREMAERRLGLMEIMAEQAWGERNMAERSTRLVEVLRQGKAVLLLDGLDEVRQSDQPWLLRELQQFITQFHHSPIVMTCRLAAQEYLFEQFTEVELADFNNEQITQCALRWFAAQGSTIGPQFIQTLQTHPALLELATNPLLLTLLCLGFENSGSFPTGLATLYHDSIQVMLRQWDAHRSIERDRLEPHLSTKEKELLLSHIARVTFEQGHFFFRQLELESCIQEYLQAHRPDFYAGLATDTELQIEWIARSIEAQHGLLIERARGIYSFSHFALHQYFVASHLINHPNTLDKAMQYLSHPQWTEIFELYAEMLPNADRLIQKMSATLHAPITDDETIRAVLQWIVEKAIAVEPSPSALTRAIYLELELEPFLELTDRQHNVSGLLKTKRFSEVTRSMNGPVLFDQLLYQLMRLANRLNQAFEITETSSKTQASNTPSIESLDNTTRQNSVISAIVQDLSRELNAAIELGRTLTTGVADRFLHYSELTHTLEQLQSQLPPHSSYTQWQPIADGWTEQLKTAIYRDRQLGHEWQLSAEQQQHLKQYYARHQLIVNCVNRAMQVSSPIVETLAATLFTVPE